MDIDIQIKSILVSLVFGFLFSLLLKINYRYIYKGPAVLRILTNFLFVVDFVLIYFVIIRNINGGVVHPYFLTSIILGFILAETCFKKGIFKFR